MQSAFLPQQMSLTFGQIGLNLGLSFALAYLVSLLYRRWYAGPSYSFSFYVTLLVSPVVVCMIMMAIGSNIALSLGLVGALSIIRFRTVIKDSRDLAFLFLMIGIGLCCGSGGYALAILGTLFVSAVLFGVCVIGKARGTPSEYILVFQQKERDDSGAELLLDEMVGWKKLQGASDLGEDRGCEYTYRVRLNPMVTAEEMLHRLRGVKGFSHSSLISPESQLVI